MSSTLNKFGTGRIAIAAAVLGAVTFGCVNLISSQVFRSARLDLTQQRLYSLSNGTLALLGEIKEPLRFRFFMSSGLTKEAPQIAAFAARVRSMLDAYVAGANGRIVLEVIDPKPFSEDEDRAVGFGISPFASASGEQLFFGLAATNSTTGRATIGVFSPDREAFLEYDLTRMVSELGRRGKAVVAVIDGLALAGNPQIGMPQQQVLTQMKQFFDVKPVGGEIDSFPDDTKVVMVVHPQNLSERTQYTLDQWVLTGGATMIFVDPYAENQIGPRGQPPADPSSSLDKLFGAWGVGFDSKRSVGDPTYALQTERNVEGRPVAAANLPWLAMRKEAFDTSDAMLSQLSAIIMTSVGSFTSTKDSAKLRPLITASAAAGTMEANIVADRQGDPRRFLANLKKADKPPVLAARLTGTLDSAYADAKPEGSQRAGDPLKKSSAPANVILVADADMLMDRNWITTRNLLGQSFSQAFANNGDFVNNAIEQMVGGAALTDLRGRGVSWRPFERIQTMEKDADARYRAKEQELLTQLKETQAKMAQLPKAEGAAADALSPQQVKAVEGFRSQMLAIRSELRDVQFALRRDVDSLKSWITAINVGLVPLGIGVIALLFALRRPKRPLPTKSA